MDTPIDYEEITKLGAIMGSGGMIVMDEGSCMVDSARFFMEFCQEESCGKFTPCREGTKRMLEILTRICKGQGKAGDIELLEELSEVAKEACLCALGTSAPNPFLSTVRYFRDEYEAHIKEKRCPALSCKELIAYHVDPAKCQACMICARKCPVDAIDGGKKTIHIIDQEKCTRCGTCFEVCPSRFNAVQKLSGEPVPAPIAEEERTIVRKSKKK
jgi:NADH-quinone oxidoreductase subunit F